MDGRIREEDQACPFCPVKDAEIGRLRQLSDDRLADCQSTRRVLEAEIERLRAAIESEAEQHGHLNRYSPCDCQICMIAREGR